MTVYVVHSYDDVWGVFSTRVLADEFINSAGDWGDSMAITEHQIDRPETPS